VRELRVKDLLNRVVETADVCEDCGSRIFLRVVDVDEDGDSGYCEYWCPRCGWAEEDFIGWKYSEERVNILGMSLRPYVAVSNIRLCHVCGRPVVGVPIVLFIKSGGRVIGEVDLCRECFFKHVAKHALPKAYYPTSS